MRSLFAHSYAKYDLSYAFYSSNAFSSSSTLLSPPILPASPSSSSSPAAPSASVAPNGPRLFNAGISYSPFTGDAGCRSASQIASDIGNLITRGGYDLVRMYGTECDQIDAAIGAITSFPAVKLMVGVFDLANLAAETASLLAQVNQRWGVIHTVSVGNEDVNKGTFAAGDVAAMANATRLQLRAEGFSGPVVAVDTQNALLAHPELCAASDYCAFNCHAFFDADAQANSSGTFVAQWIKDMRAVAGGKALVVTETGWPVSSPPPSPPFAYLLQRC